MRRFPPVLALLALALTLAGCKSQADMPNFAFVEKVVAAADDGLPVTVARIEAPTEGGPTWAGPTWGGPTWGRVVLIRNGSVVGLTPIVRAASINCAEPPRIATCDVLVLKRGALWPTAYTIEPTRFVAPGTFAAGDDILSSLKQPVDADAVAFAPFGLTATDVKPFEALALLAKVFWDGLSPYYQTNAVLIEIGSPYWMQALAVLILMAIIASLRGGLQWWRRRRNKPPLSIGVRAVMFTPVVLLAVGLPLYNGLKTVLGPSTAEIATYKGLFAVDIEYFAGRSGIEAFSELSLSLAAMIVPILLRRLLTVILKGA